MNEDNKIVEVLTAHSTDEFETYLDSDIRNGWIPNWETFCITNMGEKHEHPLIWTIVLSKH